MRPDELAALPDPDDLDVDVFDPDAPAPAADPIDATVGADPVAELDEDLLEADLGEFDLPLDDDALDDLDDQSFDSDDEEDEDDFELALLHELGIDLDAPDSEDLGVDIGVGLDDDSADDEVAA